jgi:mono/diheme cytochrome c family protein
MGKFLAGFITCIVLGVAGAVVYSYTGWQNIAAAEPENRAIGWLLHNTYINSLARAGGTVTVPANLETDANVRAGAKIYANDCVYCHGAPGEDETGMAKGINPPAPDILGAHRQNVLSESFWVVKNGVRMTAMPAWGKSHKDEEIWQVAAFLHAKKGLSADEYKKLSGDEGG